MSAELCTSDSVYCVPKCLLKSVSAICRVWKRPQAPVSLGPLTLLALGSKLLSAHAVHIATLLLTVYPLNVVRLPEMTPCAQEYFCWRSHVGSHPYVIIASCSAS